MSNHDRNNRFLFLCQPQELSGQGAHHIALECSVAGGPKPIKNGEQQQRVFRRFANCFGLLDQKLGLLRRRYSL